MKFKLINKLFYLTLSIIFLFSFSEASVREDIKDITSVNELEAYYESNSSDLYKVRYILKNLPDFLEKHGVSTCPDWVINLVDNAIYTTYGPLITESVRFIGKYTLPGYTEKLYELFCIASRNYTRYSTEMRFAIVRTLSQIGGDNEKAKLLKLFNSFPQELIGLREFGFLANKVASFDGIPEEGEKLAGTKNTEYINKADVEISKLDPGKFEDEAEYKYFSNLKNILEKINADTSLVEKGGD